jgi:hypothetical protein
MYFKSFFLKKLIDTNVVSIGINTEKFPGDFLVQQPGSGCYIQSCVLQTFMFSVMWVRLKNLSVRNIMQIHLPSFPISLWTIDCCACAYIFQKCSCIIDDPWLTLTALLSKHESWHTQDLLPIISVILSRHGIWHTQISYPSHILYGKGPWISYSMFCICIMHLR